MEEGLTPSPQSGQSATDENQKDQQVFLEIFIKTVEHFFGGFKKIFGSIADPRIPNKITYSLASLCFAGALMFLFRLGARRQITHQLRNNEPSREKLEILFNVETFPSLDHRFGQACSLEKPQITQMYADLKNFKFQPLKSS